MKTTIVRVEIEHAEDVDPLACALDMTGYRLLLTEHGGDREVHRRYWIRNPLIVNTDQPATTT